VTDPDGRPVRPASRSRERALRVWLRCRYGSDSPGRGARCGLMEPLASRRFNTQHGCGLGRSFLRRVPGRVNIWSDDDTTARDRLKALRIDQVVVAHWQRKPSLGGGRRSARGILVSCVNSDWNKAPGCPCQQIHPSARPFFWHRKRPRSCERRRDRPRPFVSTRSLFMQAAK